LRHILALPFSMTSLNLGKSRAGGLIVFPTFHGVKTALNEKSNPNHPYHSIGPLP
jgi:hypothetical protein